MDDIYLIKIKMVSYRRVLSFMNVLAMLALPIAFSLFHASLCFAGLALRPCFSD